MNCSEIFYGYNNVERWLVRESVRRLLLVIVLFLAFDNISLIAAVLCLFLIELILALFAHLWAYPFFRFDKNILDLRRFQGLLSIGFAYFAANLLFLSVWRTGELIIGLSTRDSAQIAFFSIAVSIVTALNTLFGHFLNTLIPTLSKFHSSNDTNRSEHWLGVAIRYLTVLAFCVLFLFLATANFIVPIIVGSEYVAILPILNLLLIAIIPMNIVRLAMTTAVLEKRLKRNFLLGGSALATYVVSIYAVGPAHGAFAIAIAVVLAITTAALVSVRMYSLHRVLSRSNFWPIVGMGAALLAVARATPIQLELSGTIATAVFLLLCIWLRFVRYDEIRLLLSR